ncbi:MAG: hypothetical protein K5910_08815 [Bacteroidales bacterium]|nr:hypothetical protein [Bacteroidales bacterium]
MKRVLCILLLLGTLVPAGAQRRQGREFLDLSAFTGRNRFAWEYDADFQYLFDNREFASSGDRIIPSGTLNTAIFAPTAGFSVQQNPRIHHRLSAGIELAHDMGGPSWADLPREALLFYDIHVRTRRGLFEGLAGMFPRRYMEGDYSEAFFSQMFRSTDRNLEGVLLKWRLDRLYAELGCDWMGQIGYDRRERFQVYSAGQWAATTWLSLGWTGSFYHYACSLRAPNVVDNHLLEPWLKMDFSRRTPWQELSLKAGALVSYQRDRARSGGARTPVGGEFQLTARRWNVELRNLTYVGDNLMPLFYETDPAGDFYGSDLYFGSPGYQGFYDLIQLSWAPQVNRYLSLCLAARVHFGQGAYLGCQQLFSLRFSLDALRHRDTLSGRCL